MKKKCLLILLIMLFSCNFIFAAINNDYGDQSTPLDITESTIKNNLVLDYIGRFVFAIGNIFQSLTSWVFGILTGESVFPWADTVIFNTIPLLDVNFINPDSRALFSLTNQIGIGEIVRNVYFTGLSIAVGFLGIIVGVMAIRMAISTIASEKARYKESIVKWLMSIVLLFGIHYMISFLFYMNEELVLVASRILSNSIKESAQKAAEIINNQLNISKETVIENFNEKVKFSDSDKAVINNNKDVAYLLLENSEFREALDYLSGSDKTNLFDMLGKYVGTPILEFFSFGNYNSAEEQQKAFLISSIEKISSANNISQMKSSAIQKRCNEIDSITDASQLQNLIQAFSNGETVDTSGYSLDQLKALAKEKVRGQFDSISSSKEIYEKEIESIENQLKEKGLSDRDRKYLNAMLIVSNYALKAANGQLSLNEVSDNFIANLGEYFKTTAWTIDEQNKGWAPTKVSVVSAILYTIFVFQSIGFFISYLKRVFMVVVLAILAPLVVIYDFFTKTAINSKNNIFGSWLRELSTLIFVQTFHAFLLAIIMSIIVKATAGSYITTISGEGSMQAVGLLSIFALISLPKLELLIKNIFGLTSGVADTSLAAGQRSSIVGGMFALSAGKRLLDNPRKILGGAGRVIKGHFQVRKAKNARDDYLIANRNELLKTKNGENELSSLGEGKGGKNSISDLKEAIQSLTNEVGRQSLNADKNNKSDKLAELDKAIEDAKKEKNEGYKSMAAGVSETIGAVHGGIAGAVIGAGTNKDIGETALKGAGVGDYVGEAAFNGIQSTYGLGKEIGSGLKAEARAHTGKTRKAYKQVEKELKEMNEVTNKNMDDKIKNLSKIYDSTKKNMRKSTIKTKPTSNRNTKNSKYDAGNL